MKENWKLLDDFIEQSERIVFFGGAGISTESGIPDFRSASGLYSQGGGYAYPPEVMLSRSFFMREPELFYSFYRGEMLHPEAKPNPGHRALAELEKRGKLTAVITQNIDGLHQLAGSRHVLELHGSVLRNTCMECGASYGLEAVTASSEIIPRCSVCGGMIKPDVVLYEEGLDAAVLNEAAYRIAEADLLLVGGTSLTVQPAAGLVRRFRGDKLALINRNPTPYDADAACIIRDPIGQVLGSILGIEEEPAPGF
ncbi:NAD-dependent protein deacylase [Paenibacillus lutrae]|uniref:NAD-dependent protein deacetylase n=1 Tax=Paenibacillus lutrae TaxID=2078573 RepID=A0A7X3JZ44_9BACL|nr:NAD-dependent protein deacylase [Paenibacillus lutrae]MVO99585.1 NAD-dependent protein deacylase [Paenibacillus lutrae]